MGKTYELPKLPYSYNALEPYISEQQLKIHHDKHHAGYVKGANAVLEKLDKARKDKKEIDQKAALKELSFHIGGFLLHSLFWPNLAPEGKGGAPSKELKQALEKEFGSFARFKEEFTKAAASVEGSGWAALTFCKKTNRPIIMQIEKHNVHVYPMFTILMVVDVWEHAYYLDYKNERGKFLDAFWNIMNWNVVNDRFNQVC